MRGATQFSNGGSQIKAAGGRATALKADSSDPKQLIRAVDAIAESLGGLDIVVSSAGALLFKPVEEFTLEEFDQIVALALEHQERSEEPERRDGSEHERRPRLAVAEPGVGERSGADAANQDLIRAADTGTKFPAGLPVFLYHGRDGEIVPFAHLELYAAAVPQAKVRRLDGRNHQLNDDLAAVARDIESV